MTAINNMLKSHKNQKPSKPQWTEEELVNWVQGQPEPRRTQILDILQSADAGMSLFNILTELRTEVEQRQLEANGGGGIFGYVMSAIEGYTTGSVMANAPAAVRNLANMDK